MRSGAQPGDVVALAGRIGYAAAGYTVLSRGFRTPKAASSRRTGGPRCRTRPGPQAARLGATSMIDVSDGLLADLGHVAAASGVGIDMRRDAFEIPARCATRRSALGVDPYIWILAGGDDHALAATFPPGRRAAAGFRVVGRVHEGTGVTVDGRPWQGGTGWDHFR